MLNYVARRLLWLPFLLLAVTLVTFTLGLYGPGDPAAVRLGAKATPESVERLRRQMGLDRRFAVQYTDYVWHALRGDFGESYSLADRPVTEIIGRKVWISAQLGMAAMTLAVVLGIPLGLLAAYRQGTWMDTALVSFALFFYATPVFISAPFLILFLALWLDLLPAAGWDGLFSAHAIMPTLVMGLPGVAGLARLTRASALEVLGQDYVRTARSKGLSEAVVQRRHVLRNALIPITTVLGLSLATLVEGAFITETIFGIPGIGRFAVDSIFNRDYPVIMALVIIVAVAFVLANLLVDILYAYLDPRIRYQ
jgi:ABC-type dipeptide/oligopeptide/nickel transport system permease component